MIKSVAAIQPHAFGIEIYLNGRFIGQFSIYVEQRVAKWMLMGKVHLYTYTTANTQTKTCNPWGRIINSWSTKTIQFLLCGWYKELFDRRNSSFFSRLFSHNIFMEMSLWINMICFFTWFFFHSSGQGFLLNMISSYEHDFFKLNKYKVVLFVIVCKRSNPKDLSDEYCKQQFVWEN